MDKRDLTVIENKTVKEKPAEVKKKTQLQTNPIVKKMIAYHQEKVENFGVKDLFKK